MPTAQPAGEARNEATTKPMPKMTTLVAMLCSSDVAMSQACSAGTRASCGRCEAVDEGSLERGAHRDRREPGGDQAEAVAEHDHPAAALSAS